MEDETDKTAKIENANCKGIVEFIRWYKEYKNKMKEIGFKI